MKSSKEPEGCIAQSKSSGANEHEFSLFLLLARLIEIRELWLFGRYDHSFFRVCLVIEFEGVVSVGEVLLGLRIYLHVRCNSVKKFAAVARPRTFALSALKSDLCTHPGRVRRCNHQRWPSWSWPRGCKRERSPPRSSGRKL